MQIEELEIIADVLCGGDVGNSLYEDNFEFSTSGKEHALEYFHKLKKAYEIFGLKCPFSLIESVYENEGEKNYFFFDKENDELNANDIVIEN